MENADSFQRAAQMFRALSHPNRLKIISLLSKHEMCVEEIQKLIECRQCNVSQQLLLLKKEKLVSAKRIGRRVYYSLVPSELLHAIFERTAILH